MARVSFAPGSGLGWREWGGDAVRICSIEQYGAAAAYTTIYENYGITADAVASAARESLAQARA